MPPKEEADGFSPQSSFRPRGRVQVKIVRDLFKLQLGGSGGPPKGEAVVFVFLANLARLALPGEHEARHFILFRAVGPIPPL